MKITAETLSAITGKPVTQNMESVIDGLTRRSAGITTGRRFAHFIAQVAHESAGFKYDQEIWGPTKAQLRYEGRKDLGNTMPGDGYRYRGRGPIQNTGRFNYREYTGWVHRYISKTAPDFEADPDAILESPWEGLVAVWYWETRKLNVLADKGDLRAITKRVNGGYNGLNDRYRWFTRAALVLLGYMPTDIRQFQTDMGLAVDGIAGPKTHLELHEELKTVKVSYGPDPEKGVQSGILKVIMAVIRAIMGRRG